MGRKKIKEEQIECVAYLSVEAELDRVDRLEDKQLRYIREYAKAHNVKIVGIIRRHGFGFRDVNEQLEKIEACIRKGQVQGLIVSNIMAISRNVPEAYYKVGKIRAAGGVVVTVDEGRLSMAIKENTDGR